MNRFGSFRREKSGDIQTTIKQWPHESSPSHWIEPSWGLEIGKSGNAQITITWYSESATRKQPGPLGFIECPDQKLQKRLLYKTTQSQHKNTTTPRRRCGILLQPQPRRSKAVHNKTRSNRQLNFIDRPDTASGMTYLLLLLLQLGRHRARVLKKCRLLAARRAGAEGVYGPLRRSRFTPIPVIGFVPARRLLVVHSFPSRLLMSRALWDGVGWGAA